MPTRLLILTIGDRTGASARYRAYHYLPLLTAAGFEVDVLPPVPKARGIARVLGRAREHATILRSAQAADLIMIQKRLFPVRLVRQLRAAGKPIIFDFDDAIFTSPSADWSAPTRARVSARLTTVLKAAQLVMAGNNYLAAFARSHAQRVERLPTPIDLTGYTLTPNGDGRTIGWIGSAVNHRYLDLAGNPLRQLSRELPDLRLIVVSDRDYTLPGVHVENRRWSEASEVRDLTSFDIGLMPLADNDWTRGKCALKALQYMAAGVPAICSRVGANVELIEHGVDGFLCTGDSEWSSTIREMLANPQLRRHVAARGRSKVEHEYSLPQVGSRLIELLRSTRS